MKKERSASSMRWCLDTQGSSSISVSKRCVFIPGHTEFIADNPKLAHICEQKFGVNDEKCLLCPSKKVADHCRSFILGRASLTGTPTHVRLVQYHICPEDTLLPSSQQGIELHI